MSINRQDWIIYGAYGYTGELVVREAIAQGRRATLAGRNEAKLKPFADKYELPLRAFDISDAAGHLDGAGTLINCAGPFEITAEPMMDACLERGLQGTVVVQKLSLEETRKLEAHYAEETGREFDPESISEGKTVFRIQGTGAVISK